MSRSLRLACELASRRPSLDSIKQDLRQRNEALVTGRHERNDKRRRRVAGNKRKIVGAKLLKPIEDRDQMVENTGEFRVVGLT